METRVIALVKNLIKYYSDFWGRKKNLAIDNLSLQVNKGEFFGLLGPNGSGKTTLVKLILNLIFPTAGSISIFGMPPSSSVVKARTGYLPEESSLHDFMNADETLKFHGQLYGLKKQVIDKRSDELLDNLGLLDARKRRVREYSKGMARRLGLACSLINDPEFLILDEPTSGLDPLGSRKVRNMLLQLKERGTTILMCSHLLSEIESTCDTIAILKKGKLVKSGTVSELLRRENAINIVIGETTSVSADEYRKVLETAGAKIESISNPSISLEDFFSQIIGTDENEER